MRPSRHPRPLILWLPFLLLAFAGGCARQPPGENGSQTALSGKRIRVTLTFAAPINPNYYYYFIMNVSNASLANGDKNAPGPIPVGAPVSGQPYGNGFATGSTAGTGGFTDFVLFNDPFQYPGSQARQGFGLYHVVDSSTCSPSCANDRRNFVAEGAPITFVRPSTDPTDPASTRIQFEIDLAQLIPNAATQLQAVNEALLLQYIQVNVIATNVVPTDTQTSIPKLFDSFGDTRDGRGNFLILDVSKADTISNGDIRTINTSEPTDIDDVYISPPGSANQDPALNLKDWRIDIVQQ